jgi:hypothetical protein
MERFRYGERVMVTNPAHRLFERRGTVIQVRDRDGAGRVRIERGLPSGESIVLEGTEYPDETILSPTDCERAR